MVAGRPACLRSLFGAVRDEEKVWVLFPLLPDLTAQPRVMARPKICAQAVSPGRG